MTDRPETLEQIMHRVRGQRSSLLITVENGHLAIRPVDDLSEQEQRQLWREPGTFWIAGAPIQLHEAWDIMEHPDDAEARAMAALLMVPVVARVSRPYRPPRRHLKPERVPGIVWH